MLRMSWICAALACAACGGGGDGDNPPAPDSAAPPADGPAQVATVMTVTCDGTEAATVESTGGFRFSPNNVTIAKDMVVKFVSGPSHNVIPGTAPTDPGLTVPGFGATGCLKFTAIGVYNFRCQPHSFMTGAVTVN